MKMNIFNSLYKTAFALAMAASLTACGNDWLDEFPASGVDQEQAITSAESLGTARVGLYAALKGNSTNVDYYARTFFVYGDVRGEDIQYNPVTGSNRGSMYYYQTYSTASNFSRDFTPWQSPYMVISRANLMLDAIEQGRISDQAENEALVAQYEAEALTLRALALFDMVRVYGKPYTMDNGASLGVPAPSSSVESTAKLPRNTVAECYTQIISDLTAAINSNALPTEGEAGYVNVWVAKGILSRVYLTMGNWGEALNVAKDIIDNSGYTLWTRDQYVDAWNKTNASHGNEMIFELAITGSTDWTDREGIAYLYAENGGDYPGYGDLVASQAFVNMLTSDPQDIRNDIFVESKNDKDIARYGTNKVFLQKMPATNGDVRYSNIPMMRLSEIYLTAAEAAFNDKDPRAAANYLNEVISHRTTDASKLVTSATITADRIYIERRKELVGEGHRYFDALRRGETITRYTNESDRGWHDILTESARSYDRTSLKSINPIPQFEMNANKQMVQNEGYGD